MDRGDLEREQDIEELRKIALAQHAQLQLLMELVEKQRRELGRARSKGDFQLTLKMLEELKAKAKQTQDALTRAETKKKAEPAPRSSTGPTEQPNLPIIDQVFTLDDQVFTLDDPDRTCPSCGRPTPTPWSAGAP